MPDDHIKRCDVRVPIDLYNEIEKIAVEEYNAPLYHKTGKPQVSSTIIELLKLGIENLRGELSDKIPDTLSDKVRELESRIEKIQSTSLSDNPSDTISDTNFDEKITHAIANLKSDGEFLRAIAAGVQKIISDNENYPDKNESIENKPTATRVDKASLAPIFEDVEAEQSTKPTASLTDAELAKQLGISKSTIYRYRTEKPRQSKSYQQVMQNWKPIGDRWYKQGE